MFPKRCLSTREQKRTGHLFAGCPEPTTPADNKQATPMPCGTCAYVMEAVRAECRHWRDLQVSLVQSWRTQGPGPATEAQVTALVTLARRKRPRWFDIQGEAAVRKKASTLTFDQAAARIAELNKEK